MNSPESILVVILSSFLAIFLLLAIMVVYKTVQILDHVKSITERAEKIVDTAEHVGEVFKHSATPIALAKLIAGIAEQVFKSDKKKGSK